MTQRLDRDETRDTASSRQRSDHPYAATREHLAAKNYTAGTAGNPFADRQDANASSLISILTVTASLATIFGALQGFGLPGLLPSIPSSVFSNTTTPATLVPPTKEVKVADDSGALDAMGQDGKVVGRCPLKHTYVDAKVSGYTARVTVKQIFRNPFQDKIEARYRFPLSNNGAVDEMTMKVGNRLIKGEIKRREEATEIYEQAKASGQVASLLDQERTNIFTQSIANLESGKEVEVTIKYTEVLNYKDGSFKFVFPTVVGPRFQPYGEEMSAQEIGSNSPIQLAVLNGPSTKTNTITDANRSGQDISINVAVEAGLPIQKLTSHLHGILVQQVNNHSATVSLRQASSIPNRDFVLDIDVAKNGLKTGCLATNDGKNGYVTVMVMPPAKVQTTEIAPRELIFLVDCSGSQGGKPIQKSRETLKYVVNHLNRNDTFQIITFNNTVQTLFQKPEELTLSNKMQANMFIDQITANGGTWMAPAVESACNIPADDNRLRIVSFMTDGYVGNDYEVIGLVKKLRGTSRWFPFGVGDSVNRTLIDEIAKEGGGESDFVLLNSSAEEVGRKFYERISTPVLTDVRLSTSGDLKLTDVFPRAVSDVWSEKPLFFTAQYKKQGSGIIHINGFSQGKPYRQDIAVTLPAQNNQNSQIGQVWARAKIDSLMSQDWDGAQNDTMSENLKAEIVKTALSHHLLSQFTSFVAVDRSRVTKGAGGPIASIDVPTEMPQGVFTTSSAPTAAPVSSAYGASPQSYGSNPVVGKLFEGVTSKLNQLSCAAACSAGPATSFPGNSASSAGYYYAPGNAGKSPEFNIGDIALLPLSLVPAPVRTGIIISLTLIAALGARRLAKQVAASQPCDTKTVYGVPLLFMLAMAIAIGHWNILNFH